MVANRPFHGLVSSRDQTLVLYTEISVWLRISSHAYIQNIQEFRSDGAWKVSFYALLMSASKVAKVAGTTGQTRGLVTANFRTNFSSLLFSFVFFVWTVIATRNPAENDLRSMIAITMRTSAKTAK